jgi:rRNA-processing protein FCF1
VVAVVEGQARDVAAPEAAVRVVRAPRSGDDAVVECAEGLSARGIPMLVVTADRGLRDRLPAGVPATGPGWLLTQLDRIAPAPPA